ncbi:MAG: spore cortex biosynthesis protein YabQ [Clostridiales bacterium]|nr:spore cortex biosynthesis protein YabQ [Clostridiales bacterium]
MVTENGIDLELRLLCVSYISGIIIVFAYDILGIIRSSGHHGRILRFLEELAFWGSAGWWLFSILNWANYGIIRYFSMLGLFFGMISYRITVKDVFRQTGVRLILWGKEKTVRVLRFLLKPVLYAGKRIFWFFEFWYRKGKRKLQLKQRIKKIKIRVVHKLERKELHGRQKKSEKD